MNRNSARLVERNFRVLTAFPERRNRELTFAANVGDRNFDIELRAHGLSAVHDAVHDIEDFTIMFWRIGGRFPLKIQQRAKFLKHLAIACLSKAMCHSLIRDITLGK